MKSNGSVQHGEGVLGVHSQAKGQMRVIWRQKLSELVGQLDQNGVNYSAMAPEDSSLGERVDIGAT